MANRKFTPVIELHILLAVRSGKNQKEAALSAGISPSTLQKRLSRGRRATKGQDREFYLKYEEARQDSCIVVDGARLRLVERTITTKYVEQRLVSRTTTLKHALQAPKARRNQNEYVEGKSR